MTKHCYGGKCKKDKAESRGENTRKGALKLGVGASRRSGQELIAEVVGGEVYH